MRYMRIDIREIFNKNIRFVEYSRSGVVYYTNELCELYELKLNGWKYNLCEKGFRIIPPSVTICDICECKKVEQYKNIILNLAYYLFLSNLIKNNRLSKFIDSIINENPLYYSNFSYHISTGPILETEIKLEGTDCRIETLKKHLLLSFLKTDDYNILYSKCKCNIKNNVMFEKKVENNSNVLNFYNDLIEKNLPLKNININTQNYCIDTTVLNKVDYDLILFIPFGCYKFIGQFINMDNYQKAMFVELHIDKDKPCTHRFHFKNMKNKKVLIIDSVYSGKTLLQAKEMVIQNGGIPILLGVNPKSKNILNILDYALILNKIYDCSDISSNINFEKIYIKTFKELIQNDKKNRKTSKI